MKLYPIDKLLHGMSSRYQLVNVVAHRARELAGQADDDNIPLQEKPVTTALDEAEAGTLVQETEPNVTEE